MADSPIHVVPTDDLREHITNGDPCPCLPRGPECGLLLVHNAYDGREVGEVCRDALDVLGLALSAHDHQWTHAERDAYEHAVQLLDMHWPAPAEEMEE
ncbi:MAG: hypothetical protein GY856_36975 [bacterium]|nr:hypothetical protein [bacterium]